MAIKCLIVALLLVTSSCGIDNKVNFGIEKSNLNDLSFKDINNVKEYESCTNGSISFLQFYDVMWLFIPSRLVGVFLSEEQRYESLRQQVVGKRGDSTISSATKLGGIKKIKMVDYSYEITGIWSRKYCVIVYGE